MELSLGSCTEDAYEMLERLDETYGDPRKIVDSIISEIIQYRKLRDEYK